MNSTVPATVLSYTPTHPPDALPASVYIARLDDLARLTVRLLHSVPVDQLGHKERKRLRRTVGKLLAGVARPELLIEMDKTDQKQLERL